MSKRVNFLFGFFSLFGLIGLNYFSTMIRRILAILHFLLSWQLLRCTDRHQCARRTLLRRRKSSKSVYLWCGNSWSNDFLPHKLIMSLYFPAAILGHISVGLVAICYASLITTYGIKLYNLEKRWVGFPMAKFICNLKKYRQLAGLTKKN